MCIVIILGTPLPADERVAFAAMGNRVGRRVDPRCALQLYGRARRSLQSRRRRPILCWGCHQPSRRPDGHPSGCILAVAWRDDQHRLLYRAGNWLSVAPVDEAEAWRKHRHWDQSGATEWAFTETAWCTVADRRRIIDISCRPERDAR